MMNWTDVNLVVRTIIDNEIHLRDIKLDDLYDIEKVTDIIFKFVRDEQLKQQKEVRS